MNNPAIHLPREPKGKRGVFYGPCPSCPYKMDDLCPCHSGIYDQIYGTWHKLYIMGVKVRMKPKVGRLPSILRRFFKS
jgi:hypothetical protein